MSEQGEASERDRAADRASRAARALAAVADDAARNYVEGHAVTVQPDRDHLDMVERERQARLRRWQTPPNPTRKAG